MRTPLLFFVLLFSGLTPLAIHAEEPLEIRIPKISEGDVRYHFPSDLLKVLLSKVGREFKLIRTEGLYSQARAVESLKSNKIQLHWMGTSEEVERELIPIRYPIYRGLMGYRLFIIHRQQQARFQTIRSLDDLRTLTGMQGIGWSDIEILKASGLQQSEHEYEHIFQLVQAGRGDYFSRGMFEVFLEMDTQQPKYPALAIDQRVLLTYPHAIFFFTGKQNAYLAELLGKAFELAYQDGSFEQFFYNHPIIKDGIARANLEDRVHLDIPNPALSKETAAIQPKYWHQMK